MSLRERWSEFRGGASGQELALQALVVVVLALSLTSPATTVPTTAIDAGFCSALNELFARGARAGVDWIYTWGPWGWLQGVSFDERLWVARFLVGDVLVKFVCAAVLVRAAWRLPVLERALAIAALFVLDVPGDAALYLAAFAAFDLALDRPERGGRVFGAGALVLLLGTIKFTFLLLALPLLAVLLGARAKAASPKRAFATAAGLAAVFALAWVGAGQSLFDFPAWVATSLRVSSGYDAAMSTEAPRELLQLALLALGCLALRLALATIGRGTPRVEFARAAAFAAFAFLAFKQGFVRGSDHTPIFFAIAGATAFLARRTGEQGARAACALGLRVSTLVVCGVGALAARTGSMPFSSELASRATWTENGAVILANPTWIREEGRRERESALQAWSLPVLRQRVGRAPVDVVPFQNGLMLLSDWNWKPRPVFQSYVTFDAELQERNARHFTAPDAPEYVVFALTSLDQRLPTLDDARLLRVLAQDFEPVEAEQGFLLLHRRDAARQERQERVEPRVVLERRVRFGEALDVGALGDGLHVLEADVRPSLAGRARGLLLRSPQPWIELHSHDGRVARNAIVPSMLRAGAIVDPLLANTAEWLTLFDADAQHRLARIVFLPPAGEPDFYESEIDVRILEEPRPPRIARETLTAIQKSLTTLGLDLAPFQSQLPMEGGVRRAGPGTVLLSHAPSKLRLRLPAGAHKLRGVFGVLPRAQDGGFSGPVGFRAFLIRANSNNPEPQLAVRLDPQTIEAQREPQPFEIEYVAPEGGELVLKALSLAPDGAVLEGAYWGNLKLE